MTPSDFQHMILILQYYRAGVFEESIAVQSLLQLVGRVNTELQSEVANFLRHVRQHRLGG